MSLSWKNITVARTDCGADVFALAGFLRDDDLICHDGPLGRMHYGVPLVEHIMNKIEVQATLNPNPDRGPAWRLFTACRRTASSEMLARVSRNRTERCSGANSPQSYAGDPKLSGRVRHLAIGDMDEASKLQPPLSNGVLKIVASGERKDGGDEAVQQSLSV